MKTLGNFKEMSGWGGGRTHQELQELPPARPLSRVLKCRPAGFGGVPTPPSAADPPVAPSGLAKEKG